MKAPTFFLNHKKYFFLFIIITLQLAHFTYVFACQREGVHSDENWSYGFANAIIKSSCTVMKKETEQILIPGRIPKFSMIIQRYLKINDFPMVLSGSIWRKILVHHFTAPCYIRFVPFFQTVFPGGTHTLSTFLLSSWP